MRSSSNCESYCAPPLCYLPCLPKKSKDDAAAGGAPKSAGSPSPAAVAEVDKPPVVQKMEESAAPATAAAVAIADGGDGAVGDDGNKCFKEVAVAPKSCLKRAADCEDSSKIAAKGNVKWRDLLGKDLTQVKEYEPSESGDSDDEEYTGACTCVIQ